MSDEIPERELFATFEKRDEFLELQEYILQVNLYEDPSPEIDKQEVNALQKLVNIFNIYQEQSYLLDPFLEALVVPVVDRVKLFARRIKNDDSKTVSSKRIDRLSTLLCNYVKFRGHKTITRFFPHEIADMPIALSLMTTPNAAVQEPSQWALRYITLLWLSLIVMIPFDLAQFDDEDKLGHTARSLEEIGKSYLGKAGLERESAALLLSRLYTRKDMKYAFPEFIHHFRSQILTQSDDVFTSIGNLQVINETLKIGPLDQVRDLLPVYLELIDSVMTIPVLARNTIFRKMRTKMISRIALRLLPLKRSRRKGRGLDGSVTSPTTPDDIEDFDVPEAVETLLQPLLDSIQDKDTIVRWSAAKGVGRIAERLPQDYSTQVLETIMNMFEIHSMAGSRICDLPAIAEHTWHGATLACAEMARRNLVSSPQLPTLIKWISLAVYFDLRKGSHSIGSNVRDAAAYVFWSLARIQNVSLLKPYAEDLARLLVSVSLFDREIHIRRAASAAFQEHVGRTSLFPHGIDVLGKTDFYAVSSRKHAFLVAAPQVAQHLEYRSSLIQHLLDGVLRHWDQAMRELGSQSLRIICEIDTLDLGPRIMGQAVKLLKSFDKSDIQGGLLALSEISLAYRSKIHPPQLQNQLLHETFMQLASVDQDILLGPRNGIVTAAACQLIQNSITPDDIQLEGVPSMPDWKRIVEYGLRHKAEYVQVAAASAYATISKHVDLSLDVQCLIKDLKFALSIVQQNLPCVLGLLDYNRCQGCLGDALQYLLSQARVMPKASVEVRRNCCLALPQIVKTLLSDRTSLSPSRFHAIYNTLLSGLDDYTIDERGDVGSWVRIACIHGLASCFEVLFCDPAMANDLREYLPLPKYYEGVAGILKQGVERLDNVRQEAGSCFLRVMKLSAISTAEITWSPPGFNLLRQLFIEGEQEQWNNGQWLFPRAVQLLRIEEYRSSVLRGFILSLNSKTDNTQRPASTSMCTFAKSLPVVSETGLNLVLLTESIVQLTNDNMTSNAVVIPVLRALTILLEGGALHSLEECHEGIESLNAILDLATGNVTRIKNIQRIHESMKIASNLIAFRNLSRDVIPRLQGFLAHPYPRVRADAAEYLYLLLQSIESLDVDEEAENILLETEWSSEDSEMVQSASAKFIELLETGVR